MGNQYKIAFDDRKTEVLAYLDRCVQQLREWDRTDTANSLEKLRQNVQNGLFSIVLVGEFSTGKSTFLNAIMGKRILPSTTEETTATINFLRHTDRAPEGVAGRVYYRDGSTEDILVLDRSTIEKVVSMAGNNNDKTVAATVDHVDLFLDSQFLKDGVMLVDSPGLNGMAEGHREITEKQIKASHACIFMFSADRPGSKTEFEALNQLKSESDNIFFVLNKITKINESEGETVEDVINSILSNYQKQFPNDHELPMIWPIDSYAALVARDHSENYYQKETITTQEQRDQLEQESRFAAFEDRLWQYLTLGERTRDQLCSPVKAAMKAVGVERTYWKSQVDMLQKTNNSEALEKQKELLEKEVETCKKNRKDIPKETRVQVNRVVEEMCDSLPRRVDAISATAKMQLQDCKKVSDFKNALDAFTNNMERRVAHMANDLDEKIREELLDIVQDEYAAHIEELQDRFDAHSAESGFQFKYEKIALPDGSIGVDLEKLHVECAAKMSYIRQLEDEKDQNEIERSRARKIERAIQEAKSEIKTLEESRRFFAENFAVPDVIYHTEEVDASYYRTGILGWVGNILFGKKKATRMDTVADTSARDAAQVKATRVDQDYADRIYATQKQLNQIDQPDRSADELEIMRNQLDRKIANAYDELNQLQKEGIHEIEEKSAEACNRIRNNIFGEMDMILEDLESKLKSYLKNQKRIYINAVRDLVNLCYDRELSQAQQQLDELVQLLQTQGEERNRSLESANKAALEAEKLVDTGAEIVLNLEDAMNDHIMTNQAEAVSV